MGTGETGGTGELELYSVLDLVLLVGAVGVFIAAVVGASRAKKKGGSPWLYYLVAVGAICTGLARVISLV